MALPSTVRSMKNVAVLTENEVCRYLPSFFVPTPGDLTAQGSPPPGICHPRQTKCLCPGITPEGRAGRSWNWLILVGHNTGKVFHFAYFRFCVDWPWRLRVTFAFCLVCSLKISYIYYSTLFWSVYLFSGKGMFKAKFSR